MKVQVVEPKELKWVGQRVRRKDGPEKVTGSLKYMTDYQFKSMVWGRVLRSKYPYAKIKRIDTSKAKAYPGVVCVLTHEDIPGFNGFGIVIPDQPVLCHDYVRCMGDAVALVAAETEEIAEEALQLIEVDYEVLDPVTDPEEAIKDSAPKLHPSGNIHSRVQVKNGDVEKAFAEADVIVENTYFSPRQMHAFIETEGGWGSGTVSASRSTYVGGNSVLAAAPNMIKLLKNTAAEMFNIDVDLVELRDGKLWAKAPVQGKHVLTYADIYQYLYEHRRETKVEGHFMVPKAKKQIGKNVGMPHHLYGYLTHVVLVEVDTLTGETEVLRVVSIPDCGKVINLQGLEGQAEGGAVMGIGYTLYEDTIMEGGIYKTTNFTNYILPTFKETPIIETIPVEEPEETGPFGAKGIGEVVMIPIIAAIVQAIYDATGARINHLPATPDEAGHEEAGKF